MRKKVKINRTEIKVKMIILSILAVALAVSCVFFSKPIEKALGIGKTGLPDTYFTSEVVAQNDMVVHYINMGQADSTFIELPDGTTMLIDTGDVGTEDELVDYLTAALGYEKEITHLVLTHSDQDHIAGTKAVLDAFEVENIYRPFAFAGDKINADGTNILSNFACAEYEDLSYIYAYLRTFKQQTTVPEYLALRYAPRVLTNKYHEAIKAVYEEEYFNGTEYVKSNVSLSYDGLTIASKDDSVEYEIEFYAPLVAEVNLDLAAWSTANSSPCRTTGFLTKGYISATNSYGLNSICPVIRIEYLSQKFVFTGDLYYYPEEDKPLTAEEDIYASLTAEDIAELSNISVYQAGHHGADNSNSPEFIAVYNPLWTVVSCGLNNTYGHPKQDFLKRLAAAPINADREQEEYLLRTDMNGNIAFAVTDAGELVYAMDLQIEAKSFEIEWWQICVGAFAVISAFILGIRFGEFQKYKTQV